MSEFTDGEFSGNVRCNSLLVTDTATLAGPVNLAGPVTVSGAVAVSSLTIAGESPFATVIFKPFSGRTGGNVFETWAGAVAALALIDGAKVLQFDNTTDGIGSAITVPVAGTGQLTIPATSRYVFNAGMVGRQIIIQGAALAANNGIFTISAFVDAYNVQYVNAGVVADAVYAGAWIVIGGASGTACIIPANATAWNMTNVRWYGSVLRSAPAGAGGLPVTISDGAFFENLVKISGVLAITNLSNTPNPAPIQLTFATIFQFGKEESEGIPQLTNSGTNPLFDLSLLPSGTANGVTMQFGGLWGGNTASVDFGAGSGTLTIAAIKNGNIRTGAIRGTSTGAVLAITNLGETCQLNRQNTTASPFAGDLQHGRQQLQQNLPKQRVSMQPSSVLQAMPGSSTVAFVDATGLGHNSHLALRGAGVIAQPLPVIRAGTSIANNLSATTIGALDSTGLSTTVQQVSGGGSVNVTGDLVAAGVGDSFAVGFGGVVTLTDAAGLFTAAMVGRAIVIAGSTTPANDGVFLVASFISATQVTYVNAAAVAEAFPGTWRVGDTVDGGIAAVAVPAGGSRTFRSDGVSNWQTVAAYL